MAYSKQAWRDYDDTKTENQNRDRGAVVTPERLNHMETGIANSAERAELEQTKQDITSQLAQKANIIDVTKPSIDSNIIPFIPDGITDNYDSFKSLASFLKGKTGYKIVFPPGEYRIDRYIEKEYDFIAYYDVNDIEFYGYDALITLKGDFTVPSDRRRFTVNPFAFQNGDHITIRGFEIDGENYKTETNVMAERRSHLMSFTGYCNNIILEDLLLTNSQCDGLAFNDMYYHEVTHSYHFSTVHRIFSKNIYMDNVICKNNARQGLTLGVFQNFHAHNCQFLESGITNNEKYPGISPMAGVDIEPNDIAGNKPEWRAIIKNANFNNCIFKDNVSQQFTTQWSSEIEELNFSHCKFEQILNPENTANLIGTLATTYNDCSFVNVTIPVFAHGNSVAHDEHTFHYNSTFVKNARGESYQSTFLIGSPRPAPIPFEGQNKTALFDGCQFIVENMTGNVGLMFLWVDNPNVYKFRNCEFLTDSAIPLTMYTLRGCMVTNCSFGRFNYLEATKGDIRVDIDDNTILSNTLVSTEKTVVRNMVLDNQGTPQNENVITGHSEFLSVSNVDNIVIS